MLKEEVLPSTMPHTKKQKKGVFLPVQLSQQRKYQKGAHYNPARSGAASTTDILNIVRWAFKAVEVTYLLLLQERKVNCLQALRSDRYRFGP
jgi:hypothetical protein